MTHIDAIEDQYSRAVERLVEVLEKEKTDIVCDSAIQRFEFTFDLAWKYVKQYLEEYHGVRCASPKKCIRDAYSQQLIEYDGKWLAMADDRNATAHMYKESLAEDIFARLPDYLSLFEQLNTAIREQRGAA